MLLNDKSVGKHNDFFNNQTFPSWSKINEKAQLNTTVSSQVKPVSRSSATLETEHSVLKTKTPFACKNKSTR
jgi:hypothetical protein